MPTPRNRQEELARAERPAREAMRLHSLYRGKVQVLPKCPIRDRSDLAIWYTPAVAAPCRAIQADPERVYEEWVKAMAGDAVVFACANPVPEIWPWEASEAGARIVATGRGDFPNQLNNSLGFPGIFRGALDVRARALTDGMALAAAEELARCARERGIDEQSLVPRMDEWEVFARVAAATAMKAQEEAVARLSGTREALHSAALRTIRGAREQTQLLMREGLIAPIPRQRDAP